MNGKPNSTTQVNNQNFIGRRTENMTQQPMFDPRPFLPEPHDYARWSGHRRKIFEVLRDVNWHSREELAERSGSLQVASRISQLRKAGYRIECDRTGEYGDSSYKITEYAGYDTTNPKHCDTCTCKLSNPQSEMQF